jgi:hypothetical protein
LIAFSVQFAAEVASAAAPRTVLQAAKAKQNPATRVVVIFVSIFFLPLVAETMEIVG